MRQAVLLQNCEAGFVGYNAHMPNPLQDKTNFLLSCPAKPDMIIRNLFILFILVILGAACGQAPLLPAPTASPLVYITPYATSTPVPPTPSPSPLATMPLPAVPTATPYLHVLTNDDTLLGLALQYGISLEEILAANPGINPHFLTVGKTVVIPLRMKEKTPAPTATPAPLSLGEPRCYPSVDGSAWCLVAATNSGSAPVENASAWIGLFNRQGETISGTVAISPLNVFHPGESLPLMAYFRGPLPQIGTVRSEQLSAINVSNLDARYISAEPGLENMSIDPGGLLATARGRVALPEDGTAVRSLWIVLIAYDQKGNIVGIRKWDSNAAAGCAPPVSSLTPTPTQTPQAWQMSPACLDYNLQVYSLGPTITRVEVRVEARP